MLRWESEAEQANLGALSSVSEAEQVKVGIAKQAKQAKLN